MPETIKIVLCIAPAATVGVWIATIFIHIFPHDYGGWYSIAVIETGILLGLLAAALIGWQVHRVLYRK